MRTLLLGHLLIAASLCTGCVAADASSERSTTDSIQSETKEADEIEVSAGRIVFPARIANASRTLELVDRELKYEAAYQAASKEAPAGGDVDGWTVDHLRHALKLEPIYLVGDRQSDALDADGSIRDGLKNPNGYARRVTGVSRASNGDVVFATRRASLAEATDELAKRGFAKNQADGDGCSPQAIRPFTAFHVDLSRTLYEKNVGSIGRMSIRLKDSFLTVDGNLDTKVGGACLRPEEAMAILTTNLKGQVILEGEFDGAFGAMTGSQELFHKRFPITSVLGYPLALDFSVRPNVSSRRRVESTPRSVRRSTGHSAPARRGSGTKASTPSSSRPGRRWVLSHRPSPPTRRSTESAA